MLVSCCIWKGANLGATQKDNKTALEVAEETGDEKVMQALKEFLSEQEDDVLEGGEGEE